MYKNNFQKSPKNVLKIQIKPGVPQKIKEKKWSAPGIEPG
jgi:hypothetical protein